MRIFDMLKNKYLVQKFKIKILDFQDSIKELADLRKEILETKVAISGARELCKTIDCIIDRNLNERLGK